MLAHARALLSSNPRGVTGYLDADARDTAKILTEAERLLDYKQPVAVLLIAILQLVGDADDPHGRVAELMRALPSGSYLVISHVPSDMQVQAAGIAEAAAVLSTLMTQQVTPRNHEQVTRFFDGLEVLAPGVVPVQDWRPATEEEAAAQAGMWGGVGRKA